MSKAPDFVEPFVGWKGLLADTEGNLYSPAWPTPWPVKEALVATCERKKHKPPAQKCTCGIHAVKTFEDLRDHHYNWGESEEGKIWVLAEINLWGRIRPGRIGYRAQYAYPKRVFVPVHKVQLPLAVRIRERYGVPIGIVDRFSGRRT